MKITISFAVAAAALTALPDASALQTLLPKFQFPTFGAPAKGEPVAKKAGNVVLEDKLLAAIAASGEDKRLSNSDEIASLVKQLEESSDSISRPAIAPEVMGRWRLLTTTNADTASPIQRKAVDSTKYKIYQDILLKTISDDNNEITSGEDERLIVSQVVKFSDTAELVVDALASTAAYPLEELTERKSTGKVLGVNVLGVSLVGEEALPDEDRPDSRIDFVFDEGNFNFNGFNIPYPVPFRNPLFRDWVKGWIDVTYLSDRVRISRGNKGTTFVLAKETDEM
uniref:Plastid lipid-associated protein/fibrillin conserved domain-containing protein n=1 Tax=Ditylum brightwellii TaxID=49249 RepID=A0A6U3SB38_9STRA